MRCQAGASLQTWETCGVKVVLPEWEGELELDCADEEEKGDNAGHADENEDVGVDDSLKQVIESPLWVLVRDFLSSADVLEMRTTGHKWNIARLFGSFAELWLFLFEKEEYDKSEPLPEWPSLRYDYRQIYGFDNGMFELGQLPDLLAFGSSGEWT